MALFMTVSAIGQNSGKTINNEEENLRIQDIDGNSYNTIKIGHQIWLSRNLQTTRYSDGSPIPNVTDNTEWTGLSTGAYCYYNNDSAIYKKIYGALYNWFTVVDKRNLCPTGWHIPSDNEWNTLETYLGGSRGTGGTLKETVDKHWISPNTAATNKSGFSSLPGGIRYYLGPFAYIGGFGYWWSSSEGSNNLAWSLTLSSRNGNFCRNTCDKGNGFSVRCLRD